MISALFSTAGSTSSLMKRAKRSDIVSYSRPRSLPLPSLPPFSTPIAMNAGSLRFGVRRDRQIVQRVAHQVEATRPVERHEHRRLRAVFVGGRHVDKNLPLLAHRLPGIERGIVAAEDLAVGQPHRELEVFSLGIAPVREIGIDLVVGADDDVAIAFRAGLLRVVVLGNRRAG